MPPQDNLQLPFLTRKMLNFEYGTKIELQIRSIGTYPSLMSINGITREGQFGYKHLATSDNILKTENFSISDIPILLTVTDLSSFTPNGAMFVEVNLLINGARIYQFTSGYVSTELSLTWPSINKEISEFERGDVILPASADPAAGVELSYTVLPGARLKIKSVRFTLVTAAVAVSRRVHLVITQQASAQINLFSNTDQIISETRKYWFVGGAAGAPNANDDDIYIPIPANILLEEGDTITTETVNLQATDNFGIMFILAERLMAPAL